jgi:hypothetical protein
MSAASASSRLAVAVAALALACAAVLNAQAPAVSDLDGRAVAPLAPGPRATVLIFTAVDCPISDRYAPEVRRLAGRFADAGVATWIVYANAGEVPAEARAHATAFAYGLPVALDPDGHLAARADASVTPEAAVFDAAGRLVYHGRIDDRYVDFGVDRLAPTTHDLADAVTAVTTGVAVARPSVPAVGCAIVRHRP